MSSRQSIRLAEQASQNHETSVVECYYSNSRQASNSVEEQGEYFIPAKPADVWDALQAPDVLKDCIDGCESMTAMDDDNFACVVSIKVGPVKARFNGTIRVRDRNPPHSYVLDVSAKGGGAGFGSGQALVELHEDANGTKLTYQVKGNVGGKLAQLGARLIQSFSRKMTRIFFERFSQRWAT